MAYEFTADQKRLGWTGMLDYPNRVRIRMLGRYPVTVPDFMVPFVEAMEQVLIVTGYENPCDYIGSYSKRNIAGTNKWSWHALCAIDLDYGGDNPESPDHPLFDANPHIHRRIYPGDAGFGVEWQITEAQVRAIESIQTATGKQAWRWLGWSIGDTMHWQPNATPDDYRAGPPVLTGIPIDEEQTVKRGDNNKGVAIVQRRLIERGVLAPVPTSPYGDNYAGCDGIFGADTEAAVKQVQTQVGLAPTGVVDGLTGVFIMEHYPRGGTVTVPPLRVTKQTIEVVTDVQEGA